MARKRVAINGVGRIGRLVLRSLVRDGMFEVAAVNDITDFGTIAYLLKHSTEHGAFGEAVSFDPAEGILAVGGQRIPAYSEADARKLPWGRLAIDLVLDCTGAYASKPKAQAHLDAGAKRVLISAAAGGDVPTAVFGLNEGTVGEGDLIVSGASCSTVGLAPLAKALNDVAPIERGVSTTIHALTPTQVAIDSPQAKGNLRRSRTASSNIIPTTAAAAQAVGLVVPELKGKLSGSAIRVPVTKGSLITLYASVFSGSLTADSLNTAMRAAAGAMFGYTEEELVSSDIAGTEYASVFDATLTKVERCCGGRCLVEVCAWFDNETSYVSHFIKLASTL